MAVTDIIRSRRVGVWATRGGIVAAAWFLLVLAGRAIGGGVPWIDGAVMTGIRTSFATPLVTTLATMLTALGGGRALTIVVLFAAAVLLGVRRWRAAVALCVACWSGGRVVDLAKLVVVRPRPDLVEHLAPFAGTSFPSGHAANSAIVYLSLALLLTERTRGVAARRGIVAAAVLLVAAIGCTRVYLGVHWPSDVLAGWSFGIAWVLGWRVACRD